jgi:Cupin domain
MAAAPASGALPAGHYHRTITESFFIVSGTVALYDDQTWRDATPGDYFLIPPGGIHGFSNQSGAEASTLVLFSPGAPRERYPHRVGGWSQRGPTPRATDTVASAGLWPHEGTRIGRATTSAGAHLGWRIPA